MTLLFSGWPDATPTLESIQRSWPEPLRARDETLARGQACGGATTVLEAAPPTGTRAVPASRFEFRWLQSPATGQCEQRLHSLDLETRVATLREAKVAGEDFFRAVRMFVREDPQCQKIRWSGGQGDFYASLSFVERPMGDSIVGAATVELFEEESGWIVSSSLTTPQH